MRPEPDFSLMREHDRIAVCCSCGKDSTAVIWLMAERGLLDRATVYHVDTGDLFPEVVAVRERIKAICPRWITVETRVSDWIARHGIPSDLVPQSSHSIAREVGETAPRLVHRYDCCATNLMAPLWNSVRDDGNTLCIRGTKASDVTRLPAQSGASQDGVTICHPIQAWTDEDVFSYLREVGAPISALYDHFTQAPECATCPAWLNVPTGRYLRDRHPDKLAVYRERLQAIARAVNPSLAALCSEMGEVGE